MPYYHIAIETTADGISRFIPGHITLACTVAMSAILTVLMSVYLRFENAKRDKSGAAPESYTEEQKEAERTKGDNATFYRYTV